MKKLKKSNKNEFETKESKSKIVIALIVFGIFGILLANTLTFGIEQFVSGLTSSQKVRLNEILD